MTSRERFLKTLSFQKPDDRLPMVEWAAWWDKTTDRWKEEGLPNDITWDGSIEFFGLDKLICLSAGAQSAECPTSDYHGAPIIINEKSYDEIRSWLLTESIIENLNKTALSLKEKHVRGEIIIHLWLDGYFWFPRTMFGIENHFYAFYDYPGLMHRINGELTDFNIRVVNEIFSILIPDMVGFAEDMSYNHGPMISYELFKELLIPYYQKVIPEIKKYGTKVLIDSDGDITEMIPWMYEVGIEGVYPLER